MGMFGGPKVPKPKKPDLEKEEEEVNQQVDAVRRKALNNQANKLGAMLRSTLDEDLLITGMWGTERRKRPTLGAGSN